MGIKKIAYGIMTLSFIMIVSGGVSSFLIGLQADRLETNKRIVEVNDEFEVFNANTTAFENFRDEFYTGVLSNVYYDTMFSDDINVKNKLSNYENLVDELTKNTNKMKNLCEDVYYPDSDANSKCNNYKSIYEQVVNYFISDINVYNNNIKKYNEYQTSLGSVLKLQPYSTDKDYIDFNGDGKFDGKEE